MSDRAETPAYPGYATPTFHVWRGLWIVDAEPWQRAVGRTTDECGVGWEAFDRRSHRVGLFPTQQAAGEALVKHAGYEVLR